MVRGYEYICIVYRGRSGSHACDDQVCAMCGPQAFVNGYCNKYEYWYRAACKRLPRKF